MTRGGLIFMLGSSLALPLAVPCLAAWLEQAIRGALWVALVLAALLGWR